MCTVTFIPQKVGFLLTSNRDEIPTRNAEQIIEEGPFVYPKDEGRGGTWFFVKKGAYVRCLLNGAFEKHKHTPPYAKSRGIMMLESQDYETLWEFKNNYHFEGIEPFTLVEISVNAHGITPMEIRWDGKHLFFEEFSPNERKIWSSSTLYTKEIQLLREEWMHERLPDGALSREDLFAFHTSSFTQDPSINILMRRENGPRTISITQFQSSDNLVYHRNLLTESTYVSHNQTINEN